MARLWTCGFELQSLAEFGVNSGAVASSPAPTFSTTVKRKGTASMRSNPTAAMAYLEHQIDSGTVKRTFHRLYFRVAARPDVEMNVYQIGQAGYFPATLRLLPSGALILRDSNVGTNLTGTSPVLNLNQWYRIELDYNDVAGTITSGVSAFKAYIDGVLFADTMCSNINGFSRVRPGASGVNSTCDLYYDDIAVNDTSGTVQTGLPGPGFVVHMRPNAAGDNNLFGTAVGGTAGAANNYTRVSERIPDDSTSYNSTSATGTTTIDDFNVEDCATVGIGTADKITLVQVGARVSSDVVTSSSLVYRLKSQAGGTVLESPSVLVANTSTAGSWSVHRGQSPRPYQLTAYTDPQTGTAWTPARLDQLQVGYRTDVSQTTARRVSTLWALVEFNNQYALGTASVVSQANALVYNQGNVPTFSLKDDFDDNVVSTAKWPDSYGYHVESGGRAQVGVDTNYNAYASAKKYKLAGSKIIVRCYPPTLPDGASEAWAQLLVVSSTTGTDLGMEVGIGSGTLVCFSRVGYYDPEAAYFTYDPVNHAWFKIEETGGNVIFSTSPDGHTWTQRRSIATPSWVNTSGDLELQLSGHRADGTNNYVEWDNFNVLPLYQVSLGKASTVATARPVKVIKRRALGIATAVHNLGNSVRPVKVAHATPPGSTHNLAKAITRSKLRTLGASATVNTARSLRPIHVTQVGRGLQAATAYGVNEVKTRKLGAVAQHDTARTIKATKRGTLGAADVNNVAHALNAVHRVISGLGHEADGAHKLGPVGKTRQVSQASASFVAHPVLVRKSAALGRAVFRAVSLGLAAGHRYRAAPAVSRAVPHPVVARERAYLAPATQPTSAHELAPSKKRTLGHSKDTESGRSVKATKWDRRPTPAEVVNTAHALTPRKRGDLGRALEADAARPPAGRVIKTAGILAAHTEDVGSGVRARKRSRSGPGIETSSAHGLRVIKLRRLGHATNGETTHSVGHTRLARLGNAQTPVEALLVSSEKRRQHVNAPTRERAGTVAVSKRAALGNCAARMAGLDVRPTKRMVLGVAHEAAGAHVVRIPVLNRLLHTATQRDKANALTVSKQRPADKLIPGYTAPGLTPATVPSGTRASSTGPSLTATTTTGGFDDA